MSTSSNRSNTVAPIGDSQASSQAAVLPQQVSNRIKKTFTRKKGLTASERRCTMLMGIVSCNLVRVIFIGQCAFWLYYVTKLYNDLTYLVMIVPLVLIFLDGLYLSVYRQGKEHSWFSMSIFLFSICMSFCVWKIQLTINENLPHNKCPSNSTQEMTLLHGFNSPIPVSICRAGEILVLTFMISMIASRFFLPHKDTLTKNSYTQMLIYHVNQVFIGSDQIEFYSTTAEESVESSDLYVTIILGFFSMSNIYFSFSAADVLVHSRIKRRGYKSSYDLNYIIDVVIEYVLGTEIWSLALTFIVQDFPFLVVRLVVIFRFSIDSSPIFYLLVKNIILCILEIYRIVHLVIEKRNEISESMARHESILGVI